MDRLRDWTIIVVWGVIPAAYLIACLIEVILY